MMYDGLDLKLPGLGLVKVVLVGQNTGSETAKTMEKSINEKFNKTLVQFDARIFLI